VITDQRPFVLHGQAQCGVDNIQSSKIFARLYNP
jgi:hypothetical protein